MTDPARASLGRPSALDAQLQELAENLADEYFASVKREQGYRPLHEHVLKALREAVRLALAPQQNLELTTKLRDIVAKRCGPMNHGEDTDCICDPLMDVAVEAAALASSSAEGWKAEERELANLYMQNRCGDAACEGARFSAAQSVIRGAKTHRETADAVSNYLVDQSEVALASPPHQEEIETLKKQLKESRKDWLYHSDCRPNRKEAEAAMADSKAMNDKWADEVKARRDAEAKIENLQLANKMLAHDLNEANARLSAAAPPPGIIALAPNMLKP